MRLLSLITLLVTAALAQETGQLGDATRNFDNPRGAAYRAVAEPNAHNVSGMITAITSRDGATEFAVEFGNLPSEGGPFCKPLPHFHNLAHHTDPIPLAYHIHVEPVASDGNCNSTLAHLDPFIRGEVTPCDASRPETCQVGDLGGKHGKLDQTTFNASFTDPFVSLKEGMGAFFGNRSFVLHFANRSRIACGNFSSLAEEDMEGVFINPEAPSTTTTSILSAVLTPTDGAAATTTNSIFDNIVPITTGTINGTVNPNLLTTTATSLFFANATAFVTPSSVSTGGPLQVSVSGATSIRTSFGLSLISTFLIGFASLA